MLEERAVLTEAGVGQHDAVTQQLIANALGAIADEMATTIFRTAHSTVVRDSMDFSASLCSATGEQIAQAISVPFHLGSIPTAMQYLKNHYAGSFHPGDIYIMNDPFDGGMHTPDIYVFKPIYLGDELIGFSTTTAHHADVGGRLPGTAACDNTEIFQEGLRLPWLKLYDRGEPVEDVFKIIRANVRIPRMTLGDIAAQVAACSIGERGLQQLAERYGTGTLAAYVESLLDHSERLVRGEIAKWPDGSASFVDYVGSDGIDVIPFTVEVTVTIEGDEITADFSRSAPMVRGALNCTPSFVAAAVYQAVRAALTIDVPYTEGAFRPIHVITKPGTVTEVTMPGASSMRGVTGFRVFDAVNGALAELIPHRIPAAGEGGNMLAIFSGDDDAGNRFVFYELVTGTWGGNPEDDGNDGLSNPSATAANIPVEVAEAEFPIVIEQYGLVADSAGAGRHRGGLAVERAWRLRAPTALVIVRSDRQVYPPYGLNGGGGGKTSQNTLTRRDGTIEQLPPMCTATVNADDVFYHRTAGGGGWGDPFLRDVSAVLDDVHSEKISRTVAAAEYGVVFDAAGEIDLVATEKARSAHSDAAHSPAGSPE